jgi:hypothetical protein
MVTSDSYRWRKTTDINREYASFELLNGETSILDVGFTDDGVFEVAFSPSIGGIVVEWELLQKLLDEGRGHADRDR